jgi:hypothetical protein
MTEHSIPMVTPRGSGTRCMPSKGARMRCGNYRATRLVRLSFARQKVVRPISKRDGRSTPFGVAARPELPNDRLYIIIDGDNLYRAPILFLLTSTNWRQALWLPAPGVRCSRCRSRKG